MTKAKQPLVLEVDAEFAAVARAFFAALAPNKPAKKAPRRKIC